MLLFELVSYLFSLMLNNNTLFGMMATSIFILEKACINFQINDILMLPFVVWFFFFFVLADFEAFYERSRFVFEIKTMR